MRPPPLELRLEAPRLLEARAPPPLLAPPNALPDEAGRLVGGLDLGCAALGAGLGRLTLGEAAGRLAEGVPVEGRAPAVPVEGPAAVVPAEGHAAALPVEGPAPPEPQPRACAEFALAVVPAAPDLLIRL